MEILVLNIAGTLATLVSYWAIVFWQDFSRHS
jgi:hypothetical protein